MEASKSPQHRHQEVQVEIPVHKSTQQEQDEDEDKIRRRWWLSVFMCIGLVIIGQFCGKILQKTFVDERGRGTWMYALVQTAGFPLLILPLLFFSFSKNPRPNNPPIIPITPTTTTTGQSLFILCIIYLLLGVLLAASTLFYSIAILYLSLPNLTLMTAVQLGYTLIFTFIINRQKLTIWILISVVIVTGSAVLAIPDFSFPTRPVEGLHAGNAIGHSFMVGSSAAFSLLLCLIKLSFDKVILKRNTKRSVEIILEMQIFTALIGSLILVIGLLATSERTTTASFVRNFNKGTASYVVLLVGAGVGWQVFWVGAVGLVLLVSPLFSNLVNVLVLPFLTVAGALFFEEPMYWIKILAMGLAVLGLASYLHELRRFKRAHV